eukprot:GEMP01052611.1.p1 GENE.GEMP01052611.1~~GEMP01052611.1.p1  ORF type:complete len:195 (+),score=56.06 GEMP01052611.1:739-1323(+)
MRQYADAKRATLELGFEMRSSSRKSQEKPNVKLSAGDAVTALAKEQHKYNVLRQTAEEWRRELERKQEECAMWRRRGIVGTGSSQEHGEVGSKPEQNLFRAVLLSAQLSQNKKDDATKEAVIKVEEDIEEQIFLLDPGEILLARQLLDREMPHQPLAVTRTARIRLNDILEKKNASSGRLGIIPASSMINTVIL